MSQIAVPSIVSSPRRSPLGIVLIGGVVLLALFGGWLILRGGSSNVAGAVPDNALYQPVERRDLEFVVERKGDLQAINAIDIASQVEGGTTIQSIVPEGASVKKGDTLVTLDSSAIKQRIEDTTLELQKAEADLTTSRELREIQSSQNAANLEAAEVALKLAQLDLEDYVNGAYPQQLSTATTALDTAKITLKSRQEDLSQTKTLFEKGFVTASDVKKAEIELNNAQNALNAAETALTRLTRYTHQMDLASKQNTLSQAEQKLARTKRENASQMAQRNADVAAKEQNYAVMTRRMERLQEQFDSCTIIAPTDGLVVYASSGDRNAENRIQEGTQVRERQTILRLPDTSSMKVVVRASETEVGKLLVGQRAWVQVQNVEGLVSAKITRISVMADGGQRWWNPDLKEYPVELALEYTPENLRPGITAQTRIIVGRAKDALAVKLTGLYTEADDSYVFRRDGENDRVVPVKVKVGGINASHAQIIEGVKEGDHLLELQVGQARQILEQYGIRVVQRQPQENSRNGAGNRRAPDGAAGGNAGNAERPRRNSTEAPAPTK